MQVQNGGPTFHPICPPKEQETVTQPGQKPESLPTWHDASVEPQQGRSVFGGCWGKLQITKVSIVCSLQLF